MGKIKWKVGKEKEGCKERKASRGYRKGGGFSIEIISSLPSYVILN
jgi:hypothetical protein